MRQTLFLTSTMAIGRRKKKRIVWRRTEMPFRCQRVAQLRCLPALIELAFHSSGVYDVYCT
jgi:hypothetical protein